MDLKEKLKFYESSQVKKKPEPRKDLSGIYEQLGAVPVDPNAADVLKIEKFFYYSHFCHETEPFPGQTVKLPLLSRNRLTDPIRISDILIFDLETTGLAGGAGTFPFLIGLGVFEEEGIRIFQYFLPEYGRETIAYLDLIEQFKSKVNLLSYNGKSYDYPLLRNRFILNRIDDPFKSLTHIDLLHYTRRLWKRQLPNCSLSTVEQGIFRFHRYGDIEGWMIPQAYFDFLQSGLVHEIQKIITHNQQDILSLGRLLLYMNELEQDKAEERLSENDLNVLFGLAIRNHNVKRTDEIYRQILKRNVKLPAKQLVAYSIFLKKQGLWSKAVDIWQSLLESKGYILFALEELAKYNEHQIKNYNEARQYTERAIKYISIIQELETPEFSFEYKEKFEHRLGRIEKKMGGGRQ
jgi:uncharacterized protein